MEASINSRYTLIIGKLQDPRFEFLRQVLMKIKEQAEKQGFDGTMRVSLIRVDPIEDAQVSFSILLKMQAVRSLNFF